MDILMNTKVSKYEMENKLKINLDPNRISRISFGNVIENDYLCIVIGWVTEARHKGRLIAGITSLKKKI
jgi:hypothetical protein